MVPHSTPALSHASLRLAPIIPQLAPFRSIFGSGVQCMGTITYRIARTRDVFLIHALPHDSIRLTLIYEIVFVSTLCVWNLKVDALPLRTNRRLGGHLPGRIRWCGHRQPARFDRRHLTPGAANLLASNPHAAQCPGRQERSARRRSQSGPALRRAIRHLREREARSRKRSATRAGVLRPARVS
jgi:hypothetical protein